MTNNVEGKVDQPYGDPQYRKSENYSAGGIPLHLVPFYFALMAASWIVDKIKGKHNG